MPAILVLFSSQQQCTQYNLQPAGPSIHASPRNGLRYYEDRLCHAKPDTDKSCICLSHRTACVKNLQSRSSFSQLEAQKLSSSESLLALAVYLRAAAPICARPRLDLRPPAMMSEASTSSPDKFLTISGSEPSSSYSQERLSDPGTTPG